MGRQLHDIMLDWYFEQTKNTVWLGTTPGTRAEQFYKKAGWKAAGTHGSDEIKFEMTYEDWTRKKENLIVDGEGLKGYLLNQCPIK
ncbi:MAG: hypothetical protein U5K51_16495 [Flavobacteriaceae bacterium]|nr:hypothetical protein [Flavobacteriaceae bacterium]